MLNKLLGAKFLDLGHKVGLSLPARLLISLVLIVQVLVHGDFFVSLLKLLHDFINVASLLLHLQDLLLVIFGSLSLNLGSFLGLDQHRVKFGRLVTFLVNLLLVLLLLDDEVPHLLVRLFSLVSKLGLDHLDPLLSLLLRKIQLSNLVFELLLLVFEFFELTVRLIHDFLQVDDAVFGLLLLDAVLVLLGRSERREHCLRLHSLVIRILEFLQVAFHQREKRLLLLVGLHLALQDLNVVVELLHAGLVHFVLELH